MQFTATLNKLREEAIARPLTIVLLCCIALAFAAPLSSSVYPEYVYNYRAIVTSGPTGFTFKAKVHLEILYASNVDVDGGGGEEATSTGSSSRLVRLKLSTPTFYANNNDQQPFVIDRKFNHLYNPDYDIYAHIVTLPNGTAYIRQLYSHQSDCTTFKNIKKSILLNLLSTSHHIRPNISKQSLLQEQDQVFIDDNNIAQPELFSPDSISQVHIVAKLYESPNKVDLSTSTSSNSINEGNKLRSIQPTIYQSVEGYQNVTFRSRVFSQAESNLTTNFQLDLIEEIQSKAHEKYDQAESMANAIKLMDMQNYQLDSVELQRERPICSTHHCGRPLTQLHQNYKYALKDESLASIESSVAFLRILDRLRFAKGTGVNDILEILKKMKGDYGVLSSFLDILAAVRTKDSIMASLKFLKLPKNNNLDVAERFLSVLSVGVKTASKMHLRRPLRSPYYFTPTPPLKRSKEFRDQQAKLASPDHIANELLNIIQQNPADKWTSTKLRWSTLLTLATLVNAYNQEHDFKTVEDELNQKVSSLLIKELEMCQEGDTDCRIVMLQAMGNVGNLAVEQFNVLRDHVLSSGRRESISAMKVLRDLLQVQAKDKKIDRSIMTNLKDLLVRVVYDNKIETTTRVLASEMIVRFVPNSLVSHQLLHHLPSFGNNELATMIYSRMQSLMPDLPAKHYENWYWKSSIINGSSTSFVRTMAKTDALNASYGVNVEFINRGKILKESSFDVFLDTEKRTQDLLSIGIFARGMSSFAGGGGGDEGGDEENESTMAGMSLRLLGGYLRPYVFFSGYGELMSHVISGTASEPTTVFNGGLPLIDHEEGYPLISGFVAEQQMRGVLSIDVSGNVKISWWNKNSHSVVRTKASVIVQASQSVFTGYDDLWHSHLFSFGGQALIDFVADLAFSPAPVKVCLQVTQPEFIVRYNSRRHEQLMTKEKTRRIVRRNFYIGAKSYSLNNENNKMCSLMNDEL